MFTWLWWEQYSAAFLLAALNTGIYNFSLQGPCHVLCSLCLLWYPGSEFVVWKVIPISFRILGKNLIKLIRCNIYTNKKKNNFKVLLKFYIYYFHYNKIYLCRIILDEFIFSDMTGNFFESGNIACHTSSPLHPPKKTQSARSMPLAIFYQHKVGLSERFRVFIHSCCNYSMVLSFSLLSSYVDIEKNFLGLHRKSFWKFLKGLDWGFKEKIPSHEEYAAKKFKTVCCWFKQKNQKNLKSNKLSGL